MKDFKSEFEVDGQKYPLAFTMNSMEEIQQEYKTIQNWSSLIENDKDEPDIKAIIFGFTAMINEGIEIENEDKEEKRKLLTLKQVGRLLTRLGIAEATKKIQNTIVDSTKTDESKNA